MLRAGTLNRLVTIQRRSQAKDGWGTAEPGAEAWEDVVKVWANVRHMSGSETIRAGTEVSAVRVSIRIRWRKGVDAGMRVVHAGDIYDIEAPLPDSRGQHVDLVCKLLKGPTQ